MLIINYLDSVAHIVLDTDFKTIQVKTCGLLNIFKLKCHIFTNMHRFTSAYLKQP